jgi:ParB-like chromosome segregation protein Spo0J
MNNLQELQKQIKPAFEESAIGGQISDNELNQMRSYKIMPIAILVKAAWNYKEDDEAKAEKLAANIKRNGQVQNIIVRLLPTGFYEVVNGNHRYDIMKKLGRTMLVVYDLGEITLAAAQRLAIETNETDFAVNNLKLAGLLNELTLEFSKEELAATLPYTDQ